MRSRTTSRFTTRRTGGVTPSSTSMRPLPRTPGIRCASSSPAGASRSRSTARATSSSRTRTSPAPARSGYGPRPTASPPSTTSATARSSVARVEEIQDAHRLGEKRVVAARLLLRALEHGFQGLGVGRRDTADVEEVDGGADFCERGVVLQAEGRQQHLEGHAVLDVSELRAVEVEADRLLRAFARARDPGEGRLAVDEALDQPGARE